MKEPEARDLTERINRAADEMARAVIAHRNDTGSYPDLPELCRKIGGEDAPDELIETMVEIVKRRLPCLEP